MMEASVSVAALCRAAGMSRQNYYRQRRCRQRRQVEQEAVLELVKRERQLQPELGGRKLLVRIRPGLKQAQIQVGRDRFFELLRSHNLLVRRKKRRQKTTDSRHGFRVYRNHYKDLEVSEAHQAWVADLTYLRTWEGFLYLSLISDASTRKIIGYEASDRLEAEGCLASLEQALGQLPEGKQPLHHSDRGTQYCCSDYIGKLQDRGLSISMTEENHCYENAQAERLNGILKQEYGLGDCFRTKAEARQAVDQAVWLYNELRPHLSLNYQTPSEVHKKAA
jgi:transposase InsO family protein